MLLSLLACTDYRLTHGVKVTGDDTATEATGDTDTPPDTDTDTTGGTTDTDETGDTEDTETTQPRTACANILVYSTEGSSGGGRALGWFDGLDSDAALSGWDVDVRERATYGALTSAALAGRSELWIFGTDRDSGTTLSLDEVRLVRDFVEGGGGLFLAGGPTDGSYAYGEDVNLLAQAYGVDFDDAVREGADADLREVEHPDGTLGSGVTTVPVFSGVAALGVEDAAVNVAFELDGLPKVAWRDDGVRVAFDRSWGGWRDLHRSAGDQATLVRNVAAFLEPCP